MGGAKSIDVGEMTTEELFELLKAIVEELELRRMVEARF